jgi:hypothetical protein
VKSRIFPKIPVKKTGKYRIFLIYRPSHSTRNEKTPEGRVVDKMGWEWGGLESSFIPIHRRGLPIDPSVDRRLHSSGSDLARFDPSSTRRDRWELMRIFSSEII